MLGTRRKYRNVCVRFRWGVSHRLRDLDFLIVRMSHDGELNDFLLKVIIQCGNSFYIVMGKTAVNSIIDDDNYSTDLDHGTAWHC